MGITNPNTIAKETLKSGTISIIAMGVIYTLLALMGTMSLGRFKVSENGGIALAQIATLFRGLRNYYFVTNHHCGMSENSNRIDHSLFGNIYRVIPKSNYLWLATGVSILACIFANVGLTKIIMYSTPVLMFIYP